MNSHALINTQLPKEEISKGKNKAVDITLLPNELLIIIFQFLTGKEMGNLMVTCKLWHLLIKHHNKMWETFYARDFNVTGFDMLEVKQFILNTNISWHEAYADRSRLIQLKHQESKLLSEKNDYESSILLYSEVSEVFSHTGEMSAQPIDFSSTCLLGGAVLGTTCGGVGLGFAAISNLSYLISLGFFSAIGSVGGCTIGSIYSNEKRKENIARTNSQIKHIKAEQKKLLSEPIMMPRKPN